MFCSAAAKASQWIAYEIDSFIRLRGREYILLVIVEGGGGDDFPVAVLPLRVVDEGLHYTWYDFRGKGRWRRWDRLRAEGIRDFDSERVRLAAHLNDKTPGEVEPLWHSYRRGIFRVVVSIAVAVAVVMTILALVANHQRLRAETNERESQSRLAGSYLVSGGNAIKDGRIAEAVYLFWQAVEAMPPGDDRRANALTLLSSWKAAFGNALAPRRAGDLGCFQP